MAEKKATAKLDKENERYRVEYDGRVTYVESTIVAEVADDQKETVAANVGKEAIVSMGDAAVKIGDE